VITSFFYINYQSIYKDMDIPKRGQGERLRNGKRERWASLGEVDSYEF
jgi:hypothetical protein